MGIITFTSDFGLSDARVSLVKAKIVSLDASITLIDISHTITAGSLSDAAFVLGHAYKNFPKGTVHIAAIDSVGFAPVAMELNGHYFVGADNGLFSLLAEDTPYNAVTLANKENSKLPAADLFASAAVQLQQQTELLKLGTPVNQLVKKIGQGLKATLKKIEGAIIYIDVHGNAITNIKEKVFNDIVRGRSFIVQFGREKATKINTYPNEVDSGDWYVYFNYLGLLEIGIRNGNAVQLLGLDMHQVVWISFEEI